MIKLNLSEQEKKEIKLARKGRKQQLFKYFKTVKRNDDEEVQISSE